jgi:4'-phosphopantetheinyl transferase
MAAGLSEFCIWDSPPETLVLPAAELHVWRAPLNVSAAQARHLAQILTIDERQRAGRFHFQQDRTHFVVARGVLRAILGGYLNLNPKQVPIGYTTLGKPTLTEPFSPRDLQFNLAHSDGLALYAFCRDHPVGVDLERIRPDFATAEIAQRFFAPGEVAVLQALPPALQIEAFFACWTRKEAYLKAKGSGLSVPLNSFEVSLSPAEPAALLESRDDPQEPPRWTLHALNPSPGYAAALAVEGSGWQLKCWHFESPLY